MQKNGKLLDDHKNMIETKFDVQSEQLRLDHMNSTFWVPFVINALTLQTGLFVINNYLSVGLNYGYSSSWLNMIGYVGALVNFGARLSFSIITDKVSYRVSYTIIMVFQIVNLLLLQIPNSIIYCLCCTLSFFTYGGHFVQTAVYFSKL